MNFTDWTELGVFPCQDHEPGVDPEVRRALMGGRIVMLREPDAQGNPAESTLEFGRENDMGTIGDIHPWLFWQTRNTVDRGMGSWSMAWGGLTVCGSGDPSSIHAKKPLVVMPLAFGDTHGGYGPGVDIVHELRYEGKTPYTPERSYSWTTQGQLVMVMPTANEKTQDEVVLNTDARIWAPNVCSPAESGTLVCDLQPDSTPCMYNAHPGYGGRHALLQGFMRVIAMNDPDYNRGKKGRPNRIAWNCAHSTGGRRGDGIPGYGLCFFPDEEGDFPAKPDPTCKQSDEFRHLDSCLPKDSDVSYGVGDFGRFKPWDSGGVLAQMSYAGGGPLHPGHSTADDHHVDTDGDGHNINEGHLWTESLFYRDQTFDAPLFFEDEYPTDVKDMPYKGKVHLELDSKVEPGGGVSKMWKWWCEEDHHTNGGGNGGSDPVGERPSPKDPKYNESNMGDITTSRVGETTKDDNGLKLVTYPLLSSFTEICFRPQLSIQNATSWTHNWAPPGPETDEDFHIRPQVLAMRTWGAQGSGDGTWSHNEFPKTSRAYGGTADGGILFAPPRQEIEDYFSINSDGDIYDATTMGYVTCAPDTAFALGTPNTDGGLNAKSVTIEQSAAAASNHKLLIYQLNSSRVKKALFEGELDQSSGEMIVSLASGGKECIRIPRGTTAERPGTLTLTGGEIRANTTGAETIEFLDPDSDGLGTAAWVTLATPRANVFTGHQTLNDNISLKLGTGGDSTITYNGTNTIWDPKAVGSGYVRLNGKLGFNVAPVEEVHAADTVRADTKFNHNGTDGLTGSIEFYDALGGTQTVTIRGGIITAWTS